ncbi:MAG: tRNA (guanosine(37)-N1)-methyltransferase TrmD, partial [Patescibacteria group bacterium]
ILKVDVMYKAINFAKKQFPSLRSHTVLLDPKGKTLTQATVKKFSKAPHLILICGHYEGIDARVESLVDEICSIGEYVLTGGELPALVIVDAVTRQVPGVLTKSAVTNESFYEGTLEAPHYTRPKDFLGKQVPEVLLSGNHQQIEAWRKAAAKTLTEKRIKKLK